METPQYSAPERKGCGMIGCVIAALVVLFIVLGLYGSFKNAYNTLVVQDQAVKAAWSKVDIDLQRRADLIPNVVETVKGQTKHEEAVFGRIADARAKIGAAGPGPSPEKIQASNDMTAAVRDLFVVVNENYPQLASSESFLRLQDQVEGSENRLAHSREQYNRTVTQYNNTAKSFPMVLFIHMTAFKPEYPYFEAPPESRQAPKVNF